jgi:hypothetical protein
MNWEAIDNYTSRAKVKGGWLVKSYDFLGSDTEQPVVSMAFVPDPMHGWTL